MRFPEELYKVKALSMIDNKVIVHGYYYKNICHFVDVPIDNFEGKLDYPTQAYEINPYTICRNTGIKAKDRYLYEYDLIEFNTGLSNTEVGYIEWDDYKNRYIIKTSLNYSGVRGIEGLNINIIGNIMLNDNDRDIMQEYSDKNDGVVSNPGPECRSKQRLNKLAKQHL